MPGGGKTAFISDAVHVHESHIQVLLELCDETNDSHQLSSIHNRWPDPRVKIRISIGVELNSHFLLGSSLRCWTLYATHVWITFY